jgi:hypothetical protein
LFCGHGDVSLIHVILNAEFFPVFPSYLEEVFAEPKGGFVSQNSAFGPVVNIRQIPPPLCEDFIFPGSPADELLNMHQMGALLWDHFISPAFPVHGSFGSADLAVFSYISIIIFFSTHIFRLFEVLVSLVSQTSLWSWNYLLLFK